MLRLANLTCKRKPARRFTSPFFTQSITYRKLYAFIQRFPKKRKTS
jgi:hypothetical protein